MILNNHIWINIIEYVLANDLHILIKCSKIYKNMIENLMNNKIFLYFNIDKNNILEMDSDNFYNIFDCIDIQNIDNITKYKIYNAIHSNWFIADKLFIFVDYYENIEYRNDEGYYYLDINLIIYIEQENIFINCKLEEDNSISAWYEGLNIRIITPNGKYEGNNKLFQSIYEDEDIKHQKLLEYINSDKSDLYKDVYIPENEYDIEYYYNNEDVKIIHELLVKDDNIPISIIGDDYINFHTCGSPKLNNAINELFCNLDIKHGYIYLDNSRYHGCGDWSLSSLIKAFQTDKYEHNI